MSEENKIKKPGLHLDMNSGKTITERENAHLGTEDHPSTDVRSKKDVDKQTLKERKRAKLNNKKGDFKTERSKDTGEPSAIPGAEEEGDIGSAASGAGLGGNEGRGTRSRDKHKQ